jgi:hypothetical protein
MGRSLNPGQLPTTLAYTCRVGKGGTPLPRVAIDLTSAGWAQTPDERGGQPRIARVVNCMLDGQGRIAKSLGTAALPTTTVPPGGMTRPTACGVSSAGMCYAISEESQAMATGAAVYAAEDSSIAVTRWMAPSASNCVCHSEAPYVRVALDRKEYSYSAPGILETGTDLVIVAEAMRGWTGTGSGTFTGKIELHWALLSGTDYGVKSRGTYTTGISGMPPGYRCYPVTAGPYLVCYMGSTALGVFEFDFTSMNLVLRYTFDQAANLSGTNIDASYDSATHRLIIVDNAGAWYLIDTVGWTQVAANTFGIVGAQAGTYGVARASDGLTYLAWKSSGGSVWLGAVFAITDTYFGGALSPITLWTSTYTIPTPPSQIQWRAQVSCWSTTDYNPTLGALVAFVHNPHSVGLGPQKAAGAVVAFNAASGLLSSSTIGMDLFGSVAACKPIVMSTNESPHKIFPRIWCYETEARSLRSAICLAQSVSMYSERGTNCCYPRLVGTAMRGGLTPPTPREELIGGVNAAVALTIPSAIPGLTKSAYATALLVQKTADVDAQDVYLVVQSVEGFAIQCRDVHQPANCSQATLLASAVPSQVTSDVEMSGAQYPPQTPGYAYIQGAAPDAGTYVYVVVREWKDASGCVHRSPPSDPVTVVCNQSESVRIYCWEDPWQVGVTRAVLKIYRTTNAGTVFYLITDPTGLPVPTTSAYVAFTDANTDAEIVDNEILYTQGATGGNSGQLETWGCPGCRCIWSGPDRAIAGGLENESRVRFSNLYFPGEGVSWPENAAFAVDMAEPVTAVASLDSAFLVFSRDAIWMIPGAGPDANGLGGFEVPRKISAGIGSLTWRSLVETALGIHFQAPNGQIYVVNRGSFVVSQMSQGIRDAIAQAPDPGTPNYVPGFCSTGEPWNFVLGAAYDAHAREIVFAEYSSRDWVYGLDTASWRSEVCYGNASKYCFFVAQTQLIAANADAAAYFPFAGPAIVRGTYGSNTPASFIYRPKRKQDRYPFRDRTGSAREMAFWTNDIDLWNGRIRRIWLRFALERVYSSPTTEVPGTPYTVSSNTAIWFDGLRADQTPDETHSFVAQSADDPQRFLDLEICPGRQKCNQVRFAWYQEPPAYPDLAWYLIGISLDAEGAQSGRGPIRNAAGVGRMT